MAGKPRMRPVDPSIEDFMKPYAGCGLEEIPYGEIGWHNELPKEINAGTGQISACDADSLEIRPLIDSILLAIILSSVSVDEAPKALSKAKRALGLAGDARGKPGRLPSIDDVYIRKIASQYHFAVYEDVERNVDLDTIIKAVIQEEIGHGVKWRSRDCNKLDRLREKFNDNRDKYLSDVNTENLYQRAPKLKAARRILRDLQIIGVSIELKHLDPALIEPKVRKSG